MIKVSLIRRKHYRDKLLMLSYRKKLSTKVSIISIISVNRPLMRYIRMFKEGIPKKLGFSYYISNENFSYLLDSLEYHRIWYFNSFSNPKLRYRSDKDLALMLLTEYVVNANCNMDLFNKNYRNFLFKFSNIISIDDLARINSIYQNSELFQP